MVRIGELVNHSAAATPKTRIARSGEDPAAFQKLVGAATTPFGTASSGPAASPAKPAAATTVPTAPPNQTAASASAPAAVATPTAESAFGPNPWVPNPAGYGPFGQYGYNPLYFATQATADKVAQMLGGQVVSSNELAGSGGPFAQQQPNLMVQLPNGRAVNAGLIASIYTHGYPQSYVDSLIAAQVAAV